MEKPLNSSEKLFKVITPLKQPFENREKKFKLTSPLALLVAEVLKSSHKPVEREINARRNTTLPPQPASYNVADQLFRKAKPTWDGTSENQDVAPCTSLLKSTLEVRKDSSHDLFCESDLPCRDGNKRKCGSKKDTERGSSVCDIETGSQQADELRDNIFEGVDSLSKSYSQCNNGEYHTMHDPMQTRCALEGNQTTSRKKKPSLMPLSQSQFLEEQDALRRNCSVPTHDDQEAERDVATQGDRDPLYYRSLYRLAFHGDPAPQPGLTQPVPSQSSQTVAGTIWGQDLKFLRVEDQKSTQKTVDSFYEIATEVREPNSACLSDCKDDTNGESNSKILLASPEKDHRVPDEWSSNALETSSMPHDSIAAENTKAGSGFSTSLEEGLVRSESLPQNLPTFQQINGINVSDESIRESSNTMGTVKPVSQSEIQDTSKENVNDMRGFRSSRLLATDTATAISNDCIDGNDAPHLKRTTSHNTLDKIPIELGTHRTNRTEIMAENDYVMNSTTPVPITKILAKNTATANKSKQSSVNFNLDLSCLSDEEDEWISDSVGAVVNETIERNTDVQEDKIKQKTNIVANNETADKAETFQVTSCDADDISHAETAGELQKTTTVLLPFNCSLRTDLNVKNTIDVNNNSILIQAASEAENLEETVSTSAMNSSTEEKPKQVQCKDVQSASNANEKISTLKKSIYKKISDDADSLGEVSPTEELKLKLRKFLNSNKTQEQKHTPRNELPKLKSARQGFQVPFKNVPRCSDLNQNTELIKSPLSHQASYKIQQPSTPTLLKSAPLATSTPRRKNLGVFPASQSPVSTMLGRQCMPSPARPPTSSFATSSTKSTLPFTSPFASPIVSSATVNFESSPKKIYRSLHFLKHGVSMHSAAKKINVSTAAEKPSFMKKLKAFSFEKSGNRKILNFEQSSSNEISEDEDPFSIKKLSGTEKSTEGNSDSSHAEPMLEIPNAAPVLPWKQPKNDSIRVKRLHDEDTKQSCFFQTQITFPQKKAVQETTGKSSSNTKTHSNEFKKQSAQHMLTAKFEKLETEKSLPMVVSKSGTQKYHLSPDVLKKSKTFKHSPRTVKPAPAAFQNRSDQPVLENGLEKPKTVDKFPQKHEPIAEILKQRTLQPVLMDVFKKPSASLSKRKRKKESKGSKQSSVEDENCSDRDAKRRKTETLAKQIVPDYLDGEIFTEDASEADLFGNATEIAMCLLYSDGSSQLWECPQACPGLRKAAGYVTGIAFAVPLVRDDGSASNSTLASTPRVIRVPIPTVGDAALAKRVVQTVMQSKARKLCFDTQETVTCLAQRFRVPHIHVLRDWHLLDPKIGAWLLDADHPPVTFTATLALLGVPVPQQRTLTEDLGLLSSLMRALHGRLASAGLWPIFFCLESRIASSLAVMELRGVKVDRTALSKNDKVLSDEIARLESECERVSKSAVNVNSPCQLRALLYTSLKLDAHVQVPTTPAGHKSTSEQALELLRGMHPIIELLLQHRRLSKLRNTFVAGVSSCVKDGYISPAWEQTAAATGRIQCRSPNLQALPRDPVPMSGPGAPHLELGRNEEFPPGENGDDFVFREGDSPQAISLETKRVDLASPGLDGRPEQQSQDVSQRAKNHELSAASSCNSKQKSNDGRFETPFCMSGNDPRSYAPLKNSNVNASGRDGFCTHASMRSSVEDKHHGSSGAHCAENAQVSFISPPNNDESKKKGSDDDCRKAVMVTARSALCSEADCVLVSADFQQMELRLLAHFSQDSVLLEAFNTHQDVFAMLSQKWSSVSSASSRERSKRLVYAMLYGAGPQKLAQVLRAAPADAAAAITAFNSIVPGVTGFRRRVVEQCRRQGYLTTLFKRRRHFPHICSREPRLRSHAERQAINFVIQGSAADLCKSAQLRMEARIVECGHLLSMTPPSSVASHPTQSLDFSARSTAQSSSCEGNNQKSQFSNFLKESKSTMNEVGTTSASTTPLLETISSKNHEGDAEESSCSDLTKNTDECSLKNTTALHGKKLPEANMKSSSKDQRLGLLLHIHDELVWQVPKHSAAQFVGVLREVMEDTAGLCGPLATLTVPLPVSVRAGTQWGDMRPWHPSAPGVST